MTPVLVHPFSRFGPRSGARRSLVEAMLGRGCAETDGILTSDHVSLPCRDAFKRFHILQLLTVNKTLASLAIARVWGNLRIALGR
jgi:hypothetical protein